MRQRELDQGLQELLQQKIPENTCTKLNANHADTNWQNLKETELTPYLKRIDRRNANRILCTLRSQSSTMIAARILRQQPVDVRELSAIVSEKALMAAKRAPKHLRPLIQLGAIMNFQHELLRDLYEVSLPKLEELRDVALSAGALGVKLSGAGMGGCLMALTRTASEASKILKEAHTAGAADGWTCKVDKGVKIDGTSARAVKDLS